ncbi:MAG: hypothetical protein J7M20_10865 [Deltaproteobacteria bacterium]|nr:hypothetical protein [Deltaproteobacteria bacterium]
MGCPLVTGAHCAIFHYTRLEKPLHITQHSFIRYSVTEKFHQPLVIHIIKEPFDVCIHNKVNSATLDLLTQRSESIVATPTRAEPIRVIYEILLIDRR